MKSNIFIPKKINVGYQERSGTYTKKLAYIIYYDEKGTLRKETSWNSWRNKELGNNEYENEPTSGFVLNKKAGGYSTGWNHRQTYVRVYDPRGFEFEISVPNLLYILENTNSIKGKGLEGEFVYGWDGTELILIPTESPDYKEISQYNKLVHNRVKLKGKDLKLGGTYLTKDNQEWIYLGRFDKWESDYDAGNKQIDAQGYTIYPQITKGKAYFFKSVSSYGDGIVTVKSLSSKFIGVISEECVDDYADLMDKLEHNSMYSPIDRTKDEYVSYTVQELEEKFDGHSHWQSIYTHENRRVSIRRADEKYYYEVENPAYKGGWGSSNGEPYYLKIEFNNAGEIYEKLKPIYLRKYLQNGKIYSEAKQYDRH